MIRIKKFIALLLSATLLLNTAGYEVVAEEVTETIQNIIEEKQQSSEDEISENTSSETSNENDDSETGTADTSLYSESYFDVIEGVSFSKVINDNTIIDSDNTYSENIRFCKDLTVRSPFHITEGTVIEIDGNLNIESEGSVHLSENGCKIIVRGDIIVEGQLHIPNSIVYAEKSITEIGVSQIEGNGSVILIGNKQQTLDTHSRISQLINKNTSGQPLFFKKSLNFDRYEDNGIGIVTYKKDENGNYTNEKGSVIINENTTFFVRENKEVPVKDKELIINGNLCIQSDNDVNISGFANDAAVLRIKGDFEQKSGTFKTGNQKIIVEGDYTQSGGTLVLNGENTVLNVSGNLTLQDNSVLQMQEDNSKIIVDGDFTVNNKNNVLKTGTIEIKGNFRQISSEKNFDMISDDNNLDKKEIITVKLTGTQKQEISFESPTTLNPDGSVQTRQNQFAVLELTKPRSEYDFKNDLTTERVYEKLIEPTVSIDRDSNVTSVLRTAMNIPRSHFELINSGSNLYAIGGKSDKGQILNDISRYDYENNKWENIGCLSKSRMDYAAVAVSDKIYIIGGYDGSNVLNDIEVIYPDGSTQKLELNSSQNLTGRKSHKAVYYKEHIYIIGGEKADGTVSDIVEIVDINNGSIETTKINTPRKDFGASLYWDGKNSYIVIAGGENSTGILNSVEIYDFSEKTWNTGNELSISRKGFDIQYILGNLYAVGGMAYDDSLKIDYYTNTVDAFDGNGWNTLKDSNGANICTAEARAYFGSASAYNSIFIAGGENPSVSSTFEQFMPVNIPGVRFKGDVKGLNGDFTQEETDLVFNSALKDFALKRVYNTQFKDEKSGFLGYGWKFNFESFLKKMDNKTGTVKAIYANVHESPGGTIISGVEKGTVLEITGHITDAFGTTWCEFANKYYVDSRFVDEEEKKAVEVTYPDGMKGYFTGDGSENYTASFGTYDKIQYNINENSFTLTTKDQTRYIYTADNDIYKNTAITDRYGNKVTIVYSSDKIEVTACTGDIITISKNNNSVEATDGQGRKVIYTLEADELKSVTDTLGRKTAYSYIDRSIIRIEDITPNAPVTLYSVEYDDSGRISKLTDAEGNFVSNEYKDVFIDEGTSDSNILGDLQRTVTDQNGNKTVTKYSLLEKRPFETTDAEGGKTTYKYEILFNGEYVDITRLKDTDEFYKDHYQEIIKKQNPTRETVIDQNNQKTVIEKDSMGNITSTIKPDGSRITHKYDEYNNLTEEVVQTGSHNIKTVYTYNGPYLQSVSYGNNENTETYSYDRNSKIKGIISSKTSARDNIVTKYTYNDRGEITSESTDGKEAYYDHIYGTSNNLAALSAGNIQIKIDAPANDYEKGIFYTLVKVKPEGNIEITQYDNKLNPVKITKSNSDGTQKSTTLTMYDVYGRKIKEVQPNIYHEFYDIADFLTESCHIYKYSSNGLLTEETDEENNTTLYEYDKAGNLSAMTDPGKAKYTYKYDGLNRLTEKSYTDLSGTTTVLESFSYENGSDSSKSNRAYSQNHYETIDENSKLVTKTYFDYAGRETLVENPYKIIEKEYYGDGNIKRESIYENLNGNDSYIKGKCTSDILYFYNDHGLLETKLTGYETGDKGTYFISKYLYTRDNLPEYEIAYLDAKEVSLTGIISIPADKAKACVIKYEYDGTGNVLSESSYINELSLSDLSSLKFAKRNEKEYDYSKYTITETSGEIKTITTYNYLNKPVEVKNIVSKNDFTESSALKNGNELITSNSYDLNGNLIKTISPSGNITKYSYDALGRMIKTEHPDVVSEDGGEAGVLSEITEYNWAGKVTGNKLKYKDQIKSSSEYIYDLRNNLLLSIDKIDEKGNEAVSAYEYNTIGMVTKEASPAAFSDVSSSEEDKLKKYAISNASSHTNYYYDMIGRLKASEFEGKVYEYDAQNGTFGELEKSFVTEAYKYDANDNIIKEVSGEEYNKAYLKLDEPDIDAVINNAAGTISRYSGNNLLLSEVSPNGQKKDIAFNVSYKYDALGIVNTETLIKGTSGDFKKAKTKTEYIQNEDGTTSYKQIFPDLTTKSWLTDLKGNTTEEEFGKKKIIKTYNALGLENSSVTEADRYKENNQDIVVNSKYNTIYDAEGNVVITVSNSGNTEINTYDNLNRLTSKTIGKKPSGVSDNELTADKLENSVTQRWVYDVKGNVRYEYDGEGFKTEYQYDMLDRLVNTVKKYDSKILEDRKTYDGDGNLTNEQTVLNGKQTGKESYVYDGLGRIVIKTNADAEEPYERIEYNRNSDQISSYDAGMVKTEYEYDLNRQLVKTSVSGVVTEKQEYDLSGNVSAKTDGEENTTIYHYDLMDRLTNVSVYDKHRKEETIISSYTYNTEGNIRTKTVGSKNSITYEYTASDQIKKTDTNGRTETFFYDSDGNLVKSADPSGIITVSTYTPQGWLLDEKVTDINNSVVTTAYTYDKNGNVLTSKITQNGKDNIIIREYDELGRVTKKEATDSVTSEYIYDKFTEDDELCEITRYSNGKSSSKVFDKYGREKYVYSADISKGTENIPRTEYTYDIKDRRKSIVYPNGAKSTYEYYDNNNIKTLANYVKKKDSAFSEIEYTETEKYEYCYYKNNTMKSKKETFDGILQGITSYKYDELERLISTDEQRNEENYRNISYSYDDSGNRIKETTDLQGVKTVKEYSYDNNNIFTGYTVKDKDGNIREKVKYEYDKNGNQTKEFVLFENGTENKDSETPKTQNRYNALNQLIQTRTSDFIVNNDYNAEGLRVSKEVKSVDEISGVDTVGKKHYTYEYDDIVFETSDTDPENEVWNLYGINLISRHDNDGTLYYMYNGHADVTGLIDEDGNVSEKYNYDEWGVETGSFRFGDVTGDGNVNINDFSMIKRYLFMDSEELSAHQQKLSDMNADGKVDENDLNLLKQIISVAIKNCPADTNKDGFVNEKNSIKFSGYFYDAETGLYYLNSRFYDPENARFIQEDSFDGNIYDPLSLNLYTYCSNNPISYFDPTGHFSVKSAVSKVKSAVKTVAKAVKNAVKETTKVVKKTVEVVKPAARPLAKLALDSTVNTVKNIPKEMKENWEIGIGQLKESGTVGKAFAAYSEGVVNNLENTALGIKKFAEHPVDTINEIMTDFVDDPLKPIEQVFDFYKDIAKASYTGDFETVAYKLGQGTVTTVIVGTSYGLSSSLATTLLPEGINLGATIPALSLDSFEVAGFGTVLIPSVEAVSVPLSVTSATAATTAGVVAGANSAFNMAYAVKQGGGPSKGSFNQSTSGETGKTNGSNSTNTSLSGQWKKVNESMSDFSRKYQTQITGKEGQVWYQNGVKYDGMKDGVLIDAKGKYSQFVNKNTGEFKEWFTGKYDIIDEAHRQIKASEGAKIQWYFAEESTMNAFKQLFSDENVCGIELKFEPMK